MIYVFISWIPKVSHSSFGVDKVGVYSDWTPCPGGCILRSSGILFKPLHSTHPQNANRELFFLSLCLAAVSLSQGSVQLAFKKPYTYLGLILLQD